MPDISVVIPFKDEAERLPSTIQEVYSYLRTTHPDFELILVDDGSTDGSVQLVDALQDFHRIQLVRHKVNQGKGAAIRSGVLAATGDVVLFSDADLSTPIAELQKLMPHLKEGTSVVIGSRAVDPSVVTRRQPVHRVVIGRLGNKLIRTLLGLDIQDTQCGFKLFDRQVAVELFEPLAFPGWSFDFDILHRANNAGHAIKEVPVVWENAEGSKFHAVKDTLRCVRDLVKIRFGI